MLTKPTGAAPAKTARPTNPVDPLRDWQMRMNRWFGDPGGYFVPAEDGLALAAWTPACDVVENENAIVIKAELPDVKREDVKVSVENNVLTLHGERKFEEETKRDHYHRIERSYGHFTRSFTLPNTIDSAQIVAEFKDGMLNVTLPKAPEAKPKQIEVKVS